MPSATLEMFFRLPGFAAGPSLRTSGVRPFSACMQPSQSALSAEALPEIGASLLLHQPRELWLLFAVAGDDGAHGSPHAPAMPWGCAAWQQGWCACLSTLRYWGCKPGKRSDDLSVPGVLHPHVSSNSGCRRAQKHGGEQRVAAVRRPLHRPLQRKIGLCCNQPTCMWAPSVGPSSATHPPFI